MHSVSGESRSSSSSRSEDDHDVEQAQLLPKVDEKVEADDDLEESAPQPPQKRRSLQFLIWTAINTLATIAIVSLRAVSVQRQS